jgi:hypothetical protein
MPTYLASGAVTKCEHHRFKTREDLGTDGIINNMFASEQGLKCLNIERKKNCVNFKLFSVTQTLSPSSLFSLS